jgi:hypothetical protein
MSLDATANIVCPGCSYDLRGRASDRCPECGLNVAGIESWKSGIPWRGATRIDFLDVFSTMWAVVARPISAIELSNPANLRRSRWFRAIMVPGVAMACFLGAALARPETLLGVSELGSSSQASADVALPLNLMRSGQAGPVISNEWVLVVAICSLAWAACATGIPFFWFYDRSRSDDHNARAIDIANYLSGTLCAASLASIGAAMTTGPLVIMLGGEWMLRYIGAPLLLLVCLPIGWLFSGWRAAQWLAAVNNASLRKRLSLLLGWPACLVCLFYLWHVLVPWMIGLGWIMARSW